MTDSHLLAHGQNRNQYTGSEPNHDYVYGGRSTNGLCVCGNSKASAIHFPIEGPTTPTSNPHMHERFKLIHSEDGREVVLRVCEDCQYADTEDYWRGWEARGLVRRGHD